MHMVTPGIFQVFYEKLADIKEYHRKFSSVTYETGATDAAVFDPQEFLSSSFSGDEVFGKCVRCPLQVSTSYF